MVERITPKIPDDKDIPSDDKECDDRFPPREIPDNDEVLSENQKGDDGILRHFTPDDDLIPSADHEAVYGIAQKCKIPYNETSLFKETGEILLFHKRNYKVSMYVGFMTKMHRMIMSLT